MSSSAVGFRFVIVALGRSGAEGRGLQVESGQQSRAGPQKAKGLREDRGGRRGLLPGLESTTLRERGEEEIR
jgi:hypothetical protein